MSRFDSRLLFVILSCGLLVVVLSCSQTDNIIAPKSLTKVWLTAERLPTPTPGMAYGLWVSKVSYPTISHASDVRCLGLFSHIESDTLVAFLDPDNTVRADSNEFTLDADLFDFSQIFVTVEDMTSIDSLPGPVMLMESVAGDTDTLRMFFPQHDSLFESIIRCNFQTPTDDGSYSSNGYGLWFCNYEYVRREIEDTLSAVVGYVWDTIEAVVDPEDGDTLNFATLYDRYPDTVWFEFDTVRVDFGRDTLALGIDSIIHFGAKQHVIYEVDSTIPRICKNYDTSIHLTRTMQVVYLDVFTQDLFSLPDLSSYGWQYKGWVVSDDILPTAVGEFSPPAWDFITGELLIPGYQGGLLTTGTFVDETDSDHGDPFSLEIPWEVDSGTFIDTVLKKPRFPGEDFLNGAALSVATHGVIHNPVNLLPNGDNSRSGSVFVSIEPINMVTDTTNFPLIPFCRRYPTYWPGIPVGGTGQWNLMNWTGNATGAKGFPRIEARIQRQ
ncbi:MAG: hypothetical protein NTW07_06450 [candidate division Zixibacteria bacterium]|nr:hypothetical protein [candidate division Zixibacteria bacterium]